MVLLRQRLNAASIRFSSPSVLRLRRYTPSSLVLLFRYPAFTARLTAVRTADGLSMNLLYHLVVFWHPPTPVFLAARPRRLRCHLVAHGRFACRPPPYSPDRVFGQFGRPNSTSYPLPGLVIVNPLLCLPCIGSVHCSIDQRLLLVHLTS